MFIDFGQVVHIKISCSYILEKLKSLRLLTFMVELGLTSPCGLRVVSSLRLHNLKAGQDLRDR